MEHARLRKPALSQGEDTLPGDRALLASAAECMPPMPYHSFPEYAETVQVPRYRIVVEVALHDRFEPLAGLAHRIVHTLTELLLNLPQLRSHAFADRLAPHRKPVSYTHLDVYKRQAPWGRMEIAVGIPLGVVPPARTRTGAC